MDARRLAPDVCSVRSVGAAAAKSDHVPGPGSTRHSQCRLNERRKLHSLSLLYRILHTSAPSYSFVRFHNLSRYHNLNTRSQYDNTLEITPHTSSLYSSSFTVANSRHWNSLPPEVKGCRTLISFKCKLEKYLMRSYQT
ncbi:hypothetical protein ANN_15459 [Periplaneta americana]|uniref:Uncharacterized protein n=1 Tax=Periplaneta americana TaxID=6978 RepID=A0ABQ8SHK4_PERAM|nr:hypothetical protein ANN_15459 [Periplaneta americana]